MAVNKEIEDMLSPVGLPLAYRQFKPYKNKPVPKPPYLIYIIEREKGSGADGKNLVKERTVTIELYSDRKSTELEDKVEAAISAFEFDKYEDYIEGESLYMVSYEIIIYQKIRR
jgi:hypothetical protein